MDKSNFTTKRILRIALLIEAIVFICVLLFSDPGCSENCVTGLNSSILYVLPVICLTLFIYAYVKLNELVAEKTKLNSSRRTAYIFTGITLLVLVVFGLYIIRNT